MRENFRAYLERSETAAFSRAAYRRQRGRGRHWCATMWDRFPAAGSRAENQRVRCVLDRSFVVAAWASNRNRLEWSAAESHLEHGGSARWQRDAVFGDIARFNADHLLELFVAEVWHL